MSHAFSGLFGGGKTASPIININPAAAPTVASAFAPTTQPVQPSSPSGAQSPSFLGGAAIPPPLSSGQSRGKALLGS